MSMIICMYISKCYACKKKYFLYNYKSKHIIEYVGGFMFKKLIYLIIFTFVLIFYSCNSKSEDLNTSSIENINTNMIVKKDFFDMKYVYKSIRTDKTNFYNALTNYYNDPSYSNIINRNKDFLNKKLVGNNDIKRYSIDYISNVYHKKYNDESRINTSYLYPYEDFTSYYASEYNYVEENLALKKARELLLSIKNKDADIYLALFLSHLAADSLYYFYDMQNYLVEWKKLGGSNINIMTGIIIEGNNINEIYSDNMNLINYILNAPKDLRVEQLISDAYANNFLKYISKTTGYLDIYNENNYNLSSILYDGTVNSAYISIVPDIVNNDIINKYINRYANNSLGMNSTNFYNFINYSYNKGSSLYFLEFNKNTFVYSINHIGLENIYYFNPRFISNTKYASYDVKETFNFRLGDDSKLSLAKINTISENNITNITANSKFIINGEFNKEKYYYEYLDDILPSMSIPNINFFLCDINNDGKDEIMIQVSYDYKREIGEKASYTLVLKNNLELDLESIIGKSINGSSKQGLYSSQKIYVENGKNRMLIINQSNNIAEDIFCNNDIVNVDEFNYKNYSFIPNLLWKGDLIDGIPDGILKTDASFDMFKAESDSDIAIVSDKSLRIADKLISDEYYKKRYSLDKDDRDKLLDNRRAEIKLIQDKHGNISEIEKEMLKILGIN